MDTLVAVLCLVILGSYFLWHGIGLLKGRNKGWYFAGYPFGGVVYTAIPWGIALFWLAIAALFDFTQWFWIFVFFIVFSFVALFFPPSFLKPAWLRWLEREYGSSMPLFWHEVQEMGPEYWQDQVKTQAELEAWVTKVLSKHGVIGQGRLITKQKKEDD